MTIKVGQLQQEIDSLADKNQDNQLMLDQLSAECELYKGQIKVLEESAASN